VRGRCRISPISGWSLPKLPDGSITTFDPKGSTDTTPTAINDKGEITGWYADASGQLHGFLRTP
jgi:probable HAF family extracellular repeat protein